MKTYTVTVNFSGFIGADNKYIYEAESRDEAIEMALEEAYNDLEVTNVDPDDEEED